MGRQIIFFMIGLDEEEFIDAIHAYGDAIIDRFGNILTKEGILQETWGQVFIEFPQSRVIKHEGSELIDSLISDVIKYNRTKVKGNRVRPGRLYIDLIDYDENGNKVRREKWLEDKYNIYKKWITKHCKISSYLNYFKGIRPDKGYYVGKYTYKLYKEQGYKMIDNFKINAPELEYEIEF